MEINLDDLLNAEACLNNLYSGRQELPVSIESNEYRQFVRALELVDYVYNNLGDGIAETLLTAKRKGMLRPERNGTRKEILPLKQAVRTDLAKPLIGDLKGIVSNPKTYTLLRTTIDPYPIELAYNVLQAYNSLLDLECERCVETGSLTAEVV